MLRRSCKVLASAQKKTIPYSTAIVPNAPVAGKVKREPCEPYAKSIARINKGVGRGHELHMHSGKGSTVTTVDGKSYLDFGCGIAVTNLGHCNWYLNAALKAQSKMIWHSQVSFGVHSALSNLMQKLQGTLPPRLNKFSFVTTGAEAIENAIKMARHAKRGRSTTIVMQGAYHGRTMTCLSLTTSKNSYANCLSPLPSGVIVVPFPYASQTLHDPRTSTTQLVDDCIAHLQHVLKQQVSPNDVNMILIEPVLGEGGYIAAPTYFLKRLREICDEHGILLCFDEVQTGIGRTGTFWAFEHSGVVPDILCFGKGIANGIPLAGVVTTSAISNACIPGTQGGTYAGNALAAAVGCKVVDIINRPSFLGKVRDQSRFFLSQLTLLVHGLCLPVREVRGLGMMFALEFMPEVPQGTAAKLAKLCEENGLLVMTASIFETVRIMPPLTATRKELQEGLDKLVRAFCQLGLKVNPVNARLLGGYELRPCCDGPCSSAPGVCCCRYAHGCFSVDLSNELGEIANTTKGIAQENARLLALDPLVRSLFRKTTNRDEGMRLLCSDTIDMIKAQKKSEAKSKKSEAKSKVKSMKKGKKAMKKSKKSAGAAKKKK